MSTPSLANVQVELAGDVLHLRIDRPERRNALDTATRAALIDGVDWAAGSDEVGVVVLSGRGGKAFASGADLAESATLSGDEMRAGLTGRRIYDAIAECPRPVIAMIDGYCLGGGCELAMSADIRIASSRSRFGQPEVRLGIIPGGGGTQRLPRLAGFGQAMRLILSGEIVDAGEALQLGLVDLVVPAEQLEDQTRALAESIARHSPVALGLAKRAVRASLELPLAEGLAVEGELLQLAMGSEDAAEGLAAFREKREPRFRGVDVTGPLTGMKVVEVGVAMAAPYCAMVLADLGAEVVKIERVGVGDDSRAWPPHLAGRLGHYYASANRGKRSLAVDLKSPEGVDIVRRLALRADVLVENYRVGALERAGLGYEALSQHSPRLVYCSISGFGRHGPRTEERANDLFMQAFSGTMSVTGERGGGPVKMGLSVADIGAGLFATIGILGALEARHRTGRGQHVDTSLLEGQLSMLAYHLTSLQATGIVPGPQGSGTEFGVPYQAFPTADDWLVIAVFNETMWRSFCEGVDHPDWIDDSRFVDMRARVVSRELLVGMICDVLSTNGAEHWAAVLGAKGIPCTRVNRIDQILADPQVVENGMITEVDVPGLGPVRLAAPPVHYSDTPGGRTTHPPWLGEHTREVLHELGYDDAAVDRLAESGVVGL